MNTRTYGGQYAGYKQQHQSFRQGYGRPGIQSYNLRRGFFKLVLTVQRLSGAEDKIPVTVSERLLGGIPVEHGMYFHVQGQIRSYNQQTEKGSRLIITVFAREFIPASADETDAFAYKNEVELFGYICKPVIYRTTPFYVKLRTFCLQSTDGTANPTICPVSPGDETQGICRI